MRHHLRLAGGVLRAASLGQTRDWFCPNGHTQRFVGTTDAVLRREAEARVQRAEATASHERDQRLAAQRELRRTRQRAKAGTCPCCNRSFVQLARHIKTKAPRLRAVTKPDKRRVVAEPLPLPPRLHAEVECCGTETWRGRAGARGPLCSCRNLLCPRFRAAVLVDARLFLCQLLRRSGCFIAIVPEAPGKRPDLLFNCLPTTKG